MISSLSNENFKGRKNPRLYLKRKHLKNLRQQQAKLQQTSGILKKNCESLSLALQNVSTLPPEHPDNKIVSQLWKLRFDTQYNFINGSYVDYKNAKKVYAEQAVKNYHLLKYVKTPISINGSVPIFSKTGRNMLKNYFLDKFRIKTQSENRLAELVKEDKKHNAMLRVIQD